MSRSLLDTSVLVSYWHRHKSKLKSPVTTSIAQSWGQALRDFYSPSVLATPIVIEFLAGSHRKEELDLYRAFLHPFEIIDRGEISADDWKMAKRLAERIPRDGKPRQLGDCIIAAIADRFNCDLESFDLGFPK
jgi:predicted nucleic acid-binding protein